MEYSFKELCKDKRKRKVGSNERKEAEAKAKAAGAGAAGSSEGKGKGKAEACTYKEATGAYIERTPSSLDHWDVLRNPKRYKSKHKHALLLFCGDLVAVTRTWPGCACATPRHSIIPSSSPSSHSRAFFRVSQFLSNIFSK